MLLTDMLSTLRRPFFPRGVIADGILRYYCLSLLDKHHHPDISYEEGLKLLELCTDELKRRLPIDFKGVSLTLPC